MEKLQNQVRGKGKKDLKHLWFKIPISVLSKIRQTAAANQEVHRVQCKFSNNFFRKFFVRLKIKILILQVVRKIVYSCT